MLINTKAYFAKVLFFVKVNALELCKNENVKYIN